MIYEINFFDFTWPLVLAPCIALYFFIKYVKNNDLMSKNDKIKTIKFSTLLFGTFPLVTFSYHMAANVMYISDIYSTMEGEFRSIRGDGRSATLISTSGTLEFSLYGTSCLSHKPKIRPNELILIKYTGKKNDACILSIEKVEDAEQKTLAN